MKRLITLLAIISSALLMLGSAFAAEESFTGKVVQINIGKEDLGNSQSYKFMKRIIGRAVEEKASAIILNLHTPGGLAFETSELMVQDLQPVQVPVYAFVNTQAMSAGALITATCNKIYMAPVSTIGAAGLVDGTGGEIEEMMRKKLESFFQATVRSVAKKNGHDPAIYEAMMVPAEKEITFGSKVLKKGELLTLTGEEAVEKVNDKPLLAAGIVTSVQELMKQENMTEPLVIAEQTGFEKIAWWIAWASPILILLGIGGIYIEFKTPGFGIGGVVAIIAFVLFFFGNNVAGNLAGYETVALFVTGIILICIEIFVLPGFFVFAALGVICLLSALFGGMIDILALERLFSEGGFTTENLVLLSLRPLVNLSIGLLGGLALIAVLMKYLPEWAIFRGLTNADISGGEPDIIPLEEKPRLKAGDRGTAVTELRPGGEAQFGNFQYQVVSRNGVLKKGTAVRVVRLDSFNAIVELDDSSIAEEETED